MLNQQAREALPAAGGDWLDMLAPELRANWREMTEIPPVLVVRLRVR